MTFVYKISREYKPGGNIIYGPYVYVLWMGLKGEAYWWNNKEGYTRMEKTAFPFLYKEIFPPTAHETDFAAQTALNQARNIIDKHQLRLAGLRFQRHRLCE